MVGQTNKLLGSVLYARNTNAAEGISFIDQGVAA
jgi:hypothetical protein